MIKFTDVCKAYVRYWFIILITIVLVLSAVLAVTVDDESYTATSTIKVNVRNFDSNKGQYVTAEYAHTIIKEMTKRVEHVDFLMMVIDDLKKAPTLENASDYVKSPEYSAAVNKFTPASLKAGLKLSFQNDITLFDVKYTNTSEALANIVAEAVRTRLISEQAEEEKTLASLETFYSTTAVLDKSKIAVYSVIGILIGLVLGIVLVTFFVVFNPYVENKDLLMKESGLSVLAVLDKVRGDK